MVAFPEIEHKHCDMPTVWSPCQLYLLYIFMFVAVSAGKRELH